MGFINTNDVRTFAAEKLQKHNLFETEQMFCDIYCLEPGQAQKVHSHKGASKFYYVVEGKGLFTSGEEERELGQGELSWSVPDEPHGVRNHTQERLVLLVSMAPNPN